MYFVYNGMQEKNTHCPIDDKIVWSRSSSFNIVRVLVGHVLGCQAGLGVTGGQGFTNLVPGNHSERVVGPGGHAHFEGRVGGGNDV